MITGIDHLVILVRDLGVAMEDYGRLGFTVEYGGEHRSGTHNALIPFADGSYLELIAFKEPDQPHDHPWHSALTHGEGLVAFALSSSDLAADAEAIRGRGLSVDTIGDGFRRRPDGRDLSWRNAGVGSGPRGRQRPFLIEDVTPREWRVASGRLAQHAAGVVSVVDVTLAVRSLRVAGEDIAALLGQAVPSIEEIDGGRTLTFGTPRGAIRLLEPADGSALADIVAMRSDHLTAATLGTMAQGGEPPFEADRLHGATLTLKPV